MYREVILEHYKQPHHHGHLVAPTVAVEVDNPLCGDRLSVELALTDGVITDMAFTGRGCAISQAGASILSDDLIGMPAAEAAALTRRDMVDLLGVEVGPARLKCALLGLRGVKMALAQAGVPITSYVDEHED
ncbi:MAG TPA: SUF system NifU family Fe-S cluster assembly protein [Chloroflexia bacterium]|nr:SUF system NifU family Fe-S cluster assembly protein [Chloroflexia bacterium]